MIKIAEICVKHKLEVCGADISVLLFCKNLKAHVNDQVRNVFGDEKLLLYYLLKNMTEVVQLIDAGYGRSLMWLIGYVLDICLVSEEI